MITLQNILDVAGETFKTAAAKGYTINAPITFEVNPRLNRALGRFIYNEMTVGGRKKYTFKIDISGRFNEVSAQFIDTVRHEIAHFIAFTSFEDMSHGPQWKKIAMDLGAVPKSCVSLKDDESVAAEKPRKKRQVIRAQCVCSPTLYKAKKDQYFKIQKGLFMCPACKVQKLRLVTVG
jgi:predicted SprT family Zn-dependent metalloprotease